MKNLKKLLVTMLALVLLICGATVVSLAADTPAEIMAQAQDLLDAAVKEDEFIAVRSQKMRELDKLIETNMATIRNSQEWLSFQVSYKAHQDKLREDCAVEATAALDKILDRGTTKQEAEMLFAGLSTLVARSGDARGYFDTESAEFEALIVRVRVSEAIAKLQVVEDTAVYKDKGAALLWVNNYRIDFLAEDAAVTATEDYDILTAWFKELSEANNVPLLAEVRDLTDKACLSATSFKDAQALCAEIDSYFAGCYFVQTNDYTNTLNYSKYASAYTYLNQIERTVALVSQGELLKTLDGVLQNAFLNNQIQPYYDDFYARYNKFVDFEDENSVVSRLRKIADGYKKDVADVFTPGYNGPLKTAKDIEAVVDELENLIETCYLGASTYLADVSVARIYVGLYDLYVAVNDMENAPEAFIERNKLYKAAVTLYGNTTGAIGGADAEYKAPMVALYEALSAEASAEINSILNGWIATAESADAKDADGAYVTPFEDVREAFENLNVYYLGKTTALYFKAVEDKTVTSKVKRVCEECEIRMLTELSELLTELNVIAPLPEDLADMEDAAIAFRAEREALLLNMSEGLTFVYGDNSNLFATFISDCYVSIFLTKLCQIELSFKADDDEAATVFYNELKTLVGEHLVSVDMESEGYLLYLYHLNKIEVRMGDANVPGARPYLDALAAVVDADSFDKVYALMHLDEYIRNNKITRPDESDTTSASALFYQEYDALANKVSVWRQAIVDEREKNVSLSEYNISGFQEYDADRIQPAAQLAGNTFTSKDGREYGAEGSQFYSTFDYQPGGGDGYISVNLPSSIENVIIEMDITTFGKWPASGVSFNSGTYRLDTNQRIYPWLGAISGSGQIIAPNGTSHGNGPTLTNREGGYIIPGQWTHFVIVYNAEEKFVSYYVNDEKIVDSAGNDRWSCAQAGPYNFTEALRIGHSQGGAVGSFSVDNIRLYVGDQPRDVNLFEKMSDAKKFAYYTNYVYDYIETGVGTATDAKFCYDEIQARISTYWGTKLDADGNPGEETYLFDENTYWSDGANPGITYDELKVAVDLYQYVAEHADDVIERQMIESTFLELQERMQKIQEAAGIDKLSTRQSMLAAFDAYVEANLSYIALFSEDQQAAYAQMLVTKEAVLKEVEAYSRVNDYIQMVSKFAAARDLYSRTVYRNDAAMQMASMERDSALGYFDLEAIKVEVVEFTNAIATFDEQNALLEAQILKDNNDLIVDCMARFPATPEEAMKNYSSLNKYIVMVRRILLEGQYNAQDPAVESAIALYNVMNETFYDALQRDHAATVQDLIDQFNASTTAYITKLGIYRAVKSYLEENAATIDVTHDAIKGIYSQYEIMEEKFGTEEGREEQWAEYEIILGSNTLKFITLVTQMRFATQYEEILRLRDEAAMLFYYMDSTSPEAQLAIENYQACEQFLTKAAINGDKFIEIAYQLKKATGMQETYLALLAAKAAFADIDVTYTSSLIFMERVGEAEVAVEFTTEQAIETYQIILSQYTTFVTVINAEVDVVLDVVCTVRAGYPTSRTIVALFKKFYD